jgi:hypothetical protein
MGQSFNLEQNLENNATTGISVGVGTIPLKDLLEISSKSLILIIGLGYTFGFLALNSFLSRFSFSDFNVINPKFLMVGGLVFIYFIAWYIFSGRSVFFGGKWASREIRWIQKIGLNSKWETASDMAGGLKFLAFTCISAEVFGAFAFKLVSSDFFGFINILGFLASILADRPSFYTKYPRLSIVINGISSVWIILFFSVCAYFDTPLGRVFSLYVGMSIYVGVTFSSLISQLNKDNIVFAAFYTAIFIITSVVSFGYLVYGDIRQKVGGGEPMPGHFLIDSNSVRIPWLDTSSGEFSAQLVYANNDKTLVIYDKSAIVLRTQDILATKMDVTKNSNSNDQIGLLFRQLGLAK